MKKLILFTSAMSLCFSITAQQWWALNSGTTKRLRSVLFTTDSAGVAVGQDPSTIIRTIDQGTSWGQTATIIYQGGDIHDVVLQSGQKLIGVGQDVPTGTGVMVTSTNGGSLWTENTAFGQRMFDIEFSPQTANLGWIAAAGGWIYDCTDGGVVWDSTDIGSGENMKAISFVDNAFGFTVGNAGVFYKTSNSGLNWTTLPTGTSENLNDVWFSTNQIGLVIGNAGTALGTPNAGANWIPMTTGTSEDLYGLSFVDAATGWIVGANGTIINTVDNGVNWNTQTSGTTEILRDVFMLSSTLGWACGDNGTMLLYSTISPGMGDNGEEFFNVKVYPNPSSDAITVECHNFEKTWSYILYNLKGTQVANEEGIHTSSTPLDKGNIAKGIYMLEVKNDSGQHGLQKVIFE